MAKKKKEESAYSNISIFKNSFAKTPMSSMSIEDFLTKVKDGHWKRSVETLRGKSPDDKFYKKTKSSLPAVTVSGLFNSRDTQIGIDERLIEHTGLICLDIDAKDNPKMRVTDLIDRECLAQFVSCSGKGLKIIYRCERTSDPAVHRRIYDAAIQRLEKKSIVLKVDPIVKSLGSLQYVTYDPELYINLKTKLVIKPLAPIKIKVKKPSEDQERDLAQINEYIDALGDKDITKSYDDWLTIGFGLSYSLGEAGREPFHRISKNYANYSEEECDEKYDACLESSTREVARPKTISSVFQLLIEGLPKATIKQLAKKYNKSHAVGIGEDIEQGDLAGMVRYKLFLFKKEFEKDTPTLKDLIPAEINLNEFETLLREKGFKRYDQDTFVHIVDNIVTKVDEHDILRIITEHIEADGDYCFTYKELEFNFSWEELAFLWRKIRALGTTFNQIATSLQYWEPDLLHDTADESFIPYRNGVVKVKEKGFTLLPYSSIGKQIWKDRILPREFQYDKKPGMFEDFFANICGTCKPEGEKSSDKYKRNLWYFGYMLHAYKDYSLSRAWMLYDVKAGNNGRTGKTILGQAIGHIRNVAMIDGKQVDFTNNRFALQKVNPWTEVVFIDDPKKNTSIVPFFNMITGDTDAERKGLDPITLKLKFMFASNWIMEVEETSENKRQFITQVNNFYTQYAEEKKSMRPLVDYHGKVFFSGWDALDWNKFDSFCVRALSYYMKTAIPDNVVVGNTLLVRFIQRYEEDLFRALCNRMIELAKTNSNGEMYVSQSGLIDVVNQDPDRSFNKTSAGRTVRAFFKAVGVTEIRVSSERIGNVPQMVYVLNKKLNELDFGDTINTPFKKKSKPEDKDTHKRKSVNKGAEKRKQMYTVKKGEFKKKKNGKRK